jgi:chromosome segregation ATPase
VFELPDLEGQPAWVVVVVVFLFVAGGLGTLYLKRKAREDDDEPEDTPQVEGKEVTVALPAGTAPLDLVRDSMGVLATQAAQHKADADRAEEEARDLAKQLATCGRELAVLQERYATLEVRLAECRARNGELS